MWEEHPWYQKEQARTIGLLILGLLVFNLSVAAYYRDWDLFKTTVQFAVALAAALGILSGCAWILVRILTRVRRPHPERKDSPDI